MGFLIDLEDRGSEWPYLKRIVNGIGVTISRGECLVARLGHRGFLQEHRNMDVLPRYSITRSGREFYFEQDSQK